MTDMTNPRVATARVDAQFIDRWSLRSFAPEPLTAAEIASLFEAARWAPSSSNLQPWLFLYETDGPDRPVFDSILKPGNRVWAAQAPLPALSAPSTPRPRAAPAEARRAESAPFGANS